MVNSNISFKFNLILACTLGLFVTAISFVFLCNLLEFFFSCQLVNAFVVGWVHICLVSADAAQPTHPEQHADPKMNVGVVGYEGTRATVPKTSFGHTT